jgi:hypothetical protein
MRLTHLALIVLVCIGCASTTEPRIKDLDFAYARWSSYHPSSYSFDLSIGAFVSAPGPIHIIVANGKMISSVRQSGPPFTGFFTIDTLWTRILSARASGTLNSAEFTITGVPTDVDTGDWALDSGVHYAIRNFVASQ